MIILGIDPGIARCGWGTIESIQNLKLKIKNCGCIETNNKSTLPERLKIIYSELKKIIEKDKPACLVMEKLFFAQNVKTATVVGQSQGIIMLAAAEYGIPVFEYTPLQVKQALTGQGRAMKSQVLKMVKLCLNLPAIGNHIQGPDDVGDALAVALCHFYNAKTLKLQ